MSMGYGFSKMGKLKQSKRKRNTKIVRYIEQEGGMWLRVGNRKVARSIPWLLLAEC